MICFSIVCLYITTIALVIMDTKSILVIIFGIILVTTGTTFSILQSAAGLMGDASVRITEPKAPMVASGDNLYIVWWTNKSGNWEVMFRASNDTGETIGDKINLSNSIDADSQNAEMVAQDDNVYVSWWETSTNPANKTSESVLRISNDNGATFGPILMLGDNGTLSAGGGGRGQGTTGVATIATSTPNSTSNTSASDNNIISMVSSGDEGYLYEPDTTQVNAGDTVTWTNTDDALHTVTSGSGTDENMGAEFDSGMMSTGKTFEHTFGAAGEFPYFCIIHPDMIGKVLVS
jgi:plastocyanin